MNVKPEHYHFVGDSVLHLITKIFLLNNYPELSTGDVTKLLHKLVCNDYIAKLAQFMKLAPLNNKYGDAFEDFLCQIFTEHGLNTAYNWYKDVVINDPKMKKIIQQHISSKLTKITQLTKQNN